MSYSQDLYVGEVTATPSQGKAGDSVSLQATIGNNGPGTAFTIQVQWFLSDDPEITTSDIALSDVETLSDYLYQGQETTIYKQITLPPFQDDQPPSYIGLLIDPYQFLWDDNRANNTGSAAFTVDNQLDHGFFDTVGDNWLDITHVKAVIKDENLTVTITFSEPPSSIGGIMALDMDQNPATKLDGISLAGAEALVSFTYDLNLAYISLTTASGTVSLNNISLDGSRLTYSIPLSLLGNDTDMDLFWAVDHALGPTTDFDRAPDIGVFATDSNQVVVRRPGDNTINVDISDPVSGPSEPEFPNIKRMQVSVTGDRLEIILTYNHEVENLASYPGSEGLFVWIDMDADHRLCTGFASTEEHPPAFGIDFQVRLQIDPLGGDVKQLLRDRDGDGEPETIAMGLPFNDLFVRLTGDRIICRIPLAYLGFSSGNMAMSVSSLNTRNILQGTVDRIPDKGAWDIGGNTLLTGQSCTMTPIHIDDPADDSTGAFGMDNDELTGLDTCLGNNALLFAIDYKSYLLSNQGATLIYMDTDRNPDTGQSITNIAGDTVIGADYTFRTYWYTRNLKQITKIFRADPPQVDVRNQLTAVTLANRLYITIPLECIGNPSGSINYLVQTASWGGGPILLANDDMPNHGVITIPSEVRPGDMDGDSDVDGLDLLTFMQNYIPSDCHGPANCTDDINKDGRVDQNDILTFAQNYGL